MRNWEARSLTAVIGLIVLVGGTGTAQGLLPNVLGGGMEHVATVQNNGGAGLWVHDGYAYSSGLGGGFFVTDVRDPENPVKVGHLPTYTRDADVMEVGGRVIVVAAADGGGMKLIDVTDPTNPTMVSSIRPANVHNAAVVPGTTLAYSSRGGSTGSPLRIDIVDAADPENPVVLNRWTASGSVGGQNLQAASCHDIHVDAATDRAYCAGFRQTVILDIANPADPEVIGIVDNRFVAIHHWAVPSEDGRILMIGDEDYGWGSPTAGNPNCAGGLNTPAATVSTFQGALWFYDITVPASPVLLSWVSPPQNPQSGLCTAHFGEVIPGKNQVAVGWYRAGVQLIDYSVPVAPRIVDEWADNNANAWDVRYADGYLFTGDIGHGMDVLRLT